MERLTYDEATAWLGEGPILGGALVERSVVRDPYADGPTRDKDPYTQRQICEGELVARWREPRGGLLPRCRYVTVRVSHEAGCRAWVDEDRRTAHVRWETLTAWVQPHRAVLND